MKPPRNAAEVNEAHIQIASGSGLSTAGKILAHGSMALPHCTYSDTHGTFGLVACYIYINSFTGHLIVSLSGSVIIRLLRLKN